MAQFVLDAPRTIKRWFAARRMRRQFRRAPAFAIAELPEDTPGKLVGVARAFTEAPLVAPLSGRPCVYYSIEIQELRAYGHAGGAFVTEQAGISFVLEDAGGRAVLDPRAAVISVVFDHHTQSKAAFDATREQRELLARHDLIQRDWFMTESMAYREAIIGIGERIAVLGAGTREPDPDAPRAAAYRAEPPTRLRLTGSPQHPLAITDDPRCVA